MTLLSLLYRSEPSNILKKIKRLLLYFEQSKQGAAKMNSIRPAIEELERAFQELAPVFGREMPLPVITIQSQGRKSALGWFANNRWSNTKGKLPEINICAEHLARSPEDIAEVLIHEMCHYADALDGIRDCTVRQYHNENFKKRCDEVGLICQKMRGRGWAATSLSPELLSKVALVKINPEAFTLFRAGAEKKKAETKMKKWRCTCTTIRAAVLGEATCNRCGLAFKLQS
jgi:hypothetical protein